MMSSSGDQELETQNVLSTITSDGEVETGSELVNFEAAINGSANTIEQRISSVDIEIISDEEIESGDDVDEVIDVADMMSLPPSYFNSKQSQPYVEAKTLLSDGDFETSLNLSMKGMKALLNHLSSLKAAADENIEMHPAMAPFYYLYGTTLLYSVEEGGGSDAANLEAQVIANDEESDGTDAAGPEDQNNVSYLMSNNEDLQIAWENLDLSRSILSSFLNVTSQTSRFGSFDDQAKDTSEEIELASDLAQIHLRLGDLSRHNGRYLRAIGDYEYCLELCVKILSSHGALGSKTLEIRRRRKIADVQYLLGMTYMLTAAEGEKNVDQEYNGEDDEDKIRLTSSQIQSYREKSTNYYLESGKMLSCILAIICGYDANEWNKKIIPSNLENVTDSSLLKKPKSVDCHASAILSSIRGHVACLPKCKSEEDATTMLELSDLIDEIQEAIDSADEDREGLKDVAAMKKLVQESVNGDDNPSFSTNLFAGEVTETFDLPSTNPIDMTLKPSAPNGMMQVKRKQKRNDLLPEGKSCNNHEKRLKSDN